MCLKIAKTTPLLLDEINLKLGYKVVTDHTLNLPRDKNVSCKVPAFCKICINYP